MGELDAARRHLSPVRARIARLLAELLVAEVRKQASAHDVEPVTVVTPSGYARSTGRRGGATR
jgi:hypothetical protein